MFNNQTTFNSSNAFKTPTQPTSFGGFGQQTPQFGSTNTFGQPTQLAQGSLFGSISSSQPTQSSLFSTTPSSNTTSFGFNQPISQQPSNIGTQNIDYRIKVDGKNNLQSINCKLDLKDKSLTELQYEDRFKKSCGVSQPAALPAPSSNSSSFGSSLFNSSQSSSPGFNTSFNTTSNLFNKPTTTPPISSTGGFGSTTSLFNKPTPTQSTGMFGSSTPNFSGTSNMNTSFGMGNTTSSSLFNKPTTMGGLNTSTNTNTGSGLFQRSNTGLNTSLNSTINPNTANTNLNTGTGFGFNTGLSNTNTTTNTIGSTNSLFNKPTTSSIFNTTPSSTLNTSNQTPTSNTLFTTNRNLNTSTNSLFNKPPTSSLFSTPTTNTTNSMLGSGLNPTINSSSLSTNRLGTSNLFNTNNINNTQSTLFMSNLNTMNNRTNNLNSLTQQQLIDSTNPYMVNLELSKQTTITQDYIKSINTSLIKSYESSNLSLESHTNNSIEENNLNNKNVKIIQTNKSRNGFTMVKDHIENSRKFIKKINNETTIKMFKVPTKKLETTPNIDDILDKNNVDGFKVRNLEFGCIEWLRKIDIENVKFDSIFVFKNGSLEVNPNKALGFNKVNTKALITFYNIWPKNEYGEREKTDSIIKLSKYENALRKYIEQIKGSEFSKYNYKNGEMSFIVRNFDYFINK